MVRHVLSYTEINKSAGVNYLATTLLTETKKLTKAAVWSPRKNLKLTGNHIKCQFFWAGHFLVLSRKLIRSVVSIARNTEAPKK